MNFRNDLTISSWLILTLLSLLVILGIVIAASLRSSPTRSLSSGSTTTISTPRIVHLPTATPACRVAIAPREYDVSVAAGPRGGIPTILQLRHAFAHYRGRRAALVLTFGHPPYSDRNQSEFAAASDGNKRAHAVNVLLKKLFPGIFGDAATKDFHDLGASDGSVDFQIYFFKTVCS